MMAAFPWLAGCLIAWGAAGESVAVTPTVLTAGPGADTEAAWSPDGQKIVFVSDRGGTHGLYLLEVTTNRITPLVQGPGHASSPAWSPDAKWIVYSYAHFTKTAMEGQPDGYNLFVVPVGGGSPRRLTSGRFHDTCPTVTPDGKRVWFSSERGNTSKTGTAISFYCVPWEGGDSTPVLPQQGDDRAVVQATFSPDGRTVAFGRINSFYNNWRVGLAQTGQPESGYLLSDALSSFYAPRWSPVGDRLACTGFQVGDPGWQVYLIDARCGRRIRLDCGPGNSRNPAWSSDGRFLVFENNRSGQYKLYWLVAPTPPALPAEPDSHTASGAILHFLFSKRPDRTVADSSPRGNAGQVQGQPAWSDGAVHMNKSTDCITVPDAKGCDFGPGPFSVRAVVKVSKGSGAAIIAMGEYPGNPLGWQLYLGDDYRVHFNSRGDGQAYRGAFSDDSIPLDRPVTLVGTRDASGRVHLYVDGVLQRRSAAGATCVYGRPAQVRIASQQGGKMLFPGWIYEVAVFNRPLTADEARGDGLSRLWAQWDRVKP